MLPLRKHDPIGEPEPIVETIDLLAIDVSDPLEAGEPEILLGAPNETVDLYREMPFGSRMVRKLSDSEAST
jgi:hypothetical protein